MYRLLALLCLVLPLATQARPTPRTQRHDTPCNQAERQASSGAERTARRRTRKVVLDKRAMDRQLRDARQDLAELERLIARLHRRQSRRALAEQVDRLRDRLTAMENTLDDAKRYRPAPKRRVKRRPKAMSQSDFARLERSVRAEPFHDDKLRVIRHAVRYHHFTSAQAYALARRLSFGDDTVDALAMLHPRVVDPQNFHLAYRALRHPSDRRDLDTRLARQRS